MASNSRPPCSPTAESGRRRPHTERAGQRPETQKGRAQRAACLSLEARTLPCDSLGPGRHQGGPSYCSPEEHH
eukprot:3935077-Pleurochrysis_carterae.AAC.2